MRVPKNELPPCVEFPTETFFPEKDTPTETAAIRKICAGCTIFDQCFEWAMKHEDYGIWAGTTPPDRVRYREATGTKFELLVFDPFDDNNLRSVYGSGSVKVGEL